MLKLVIFTHYPDTLQANFKGIFIHEIHYFPRENFLSNLQIKLLANFSNESQSIVSKSHL